jgi:predicted RNase H-like HicB family nuclease
MTPQSPEELVHSYLALPWTWKINFDADTACWIVSIDQLPDFFAAGAKAGEAARNGRDALSSHLLGYLATGTTIPFPPSNASAGSVTSGMDDNALVEIAA